MTATTKLQATLSSTTCPYCGVELGSTGDSINRCFSCRGLLDPLSRQASQNDMGPWFIRDDKTPFRPGCSYEVLRALASKGRLSRDTIIRGPSTRQFWMSASQTPGIGHLFGSCHSCGTECSPTDVTCDECHASFVIESNRQHLGLGPIHLIPGTGTGLTPAPSSSRLKSLVGDSIDEEQLIAASATTLPRDELPEATPEFRSSFNSPRRGDAGVISSADLQALENKLSSSRLLLLVTSLVAALCLAATILIVLDVKQDLGLGLARTLRPAATPLPPTDTPTQTPVDNVSIPVIPSPPQSAPPPSDLAEVPPPPKPRGIAGSPSQNSPLPSTPPPATTPGPHDKPTPDGEKIPADSPSLTHDPRWNNVIALLQAGDRDSVLKALTLVNDLETAKLPPPATRPDLPQAVRTKAALMTLSPASPTTSPK